eukprot:COSAG02_NODE_41681_length_392_cov_0.645051_1_plen_127_part_10
MGPGAASEAEKDGETSGNQGFEADGTNVEQHLDEQETTDRASIDTTLQQRDIFEDETDGMSIETRASSRALAKECIVQELRLKYGDCYPTTLSTTMKRLYRDRFNGTVAEHDVFEGSEPAERPVAKA